MLTGWKLSYEFDEGATSTLGRTLCHSPSVHQVSLHIPLDPVTWLVFPTVYHSMQFLGIQWGSAHPVLTLTWQESFPPSLKPAQIMLLVIEPYEALHLVLDTMGTLTSCRFWGKGRGTARGKKSVVNIDSGLQSTVSCVLSCSKCVLSRDTFIRIIINLIIRIYVLKCTISVALRV